MRDRNGILYPQRAAPTWPQIRLTGDRAFTDPFFAVLVEAMDADALRADLASPSLNAATEVRIVDSIRRVDGDAILVEPRHHLVRGAHYLIGLGRDSIDADGAAYVADVRVSTDTTAGAWAAESWPADGTVGVPSSVPLLAVRFDGSILLGAESLVLEGPAGIVAATGAAVGCAGIGFGPGSCAELRPETELTGGTTYHLRVDHRLVDPTGAPPGPFIAEMITSVGEAPEVRFASVTCAVDEDSVGPTCLLADDTRIVLRVAATGPARFFVSGGSRSDAEVAPRGAARLTLSGLPPATTFTVNLRLVDLALRHREDTFEVTTAPRLAPLSIAEVRADPEGPEPAQEYVEVLNSGAMPVDLAGFRLADREDREGDLIAAPSIVPAGGRILLVADGFDPRHEADAPVPDGVPLARLGTSLASAGLSNAGEALFLRDPEGRRVSAAPKTAAVTGQCLVRTALDGRRGDAAAFVIGPCTPGRPHGLHEDGRAP